MYNHSNYFKMHPICRKVERKTNGTKLVPGKCEGWLNAHWSPLADDSQGVIEVHGHKYCPYCHSRYMVAMDYVRFGSK